MKKLKYFFDFLIIFLIFDALIISKNYVIAVPITCFYIAYKLFKNKSSIYAFKGNLYFEKKDYNSALHFYEKACLNPKVDSSIILKYAYILLYCGKLTACKEMLDSINYNALKSNLKISYTITESLYLWKSGNLSSSIIKCRQINPEFKHTLLYETLGYLLVLSGNYIEALKYNEEAYEYDNESLIIADNLAQSYYFLGNFEKAAKIYTKIIEDNDKKPTFMEPYFYYGLILKSNGNFDSSLKYFNIALSMKESFLSSLTHNRIQEEINSITASINPPNTNL